jgi:hypothetical protein
MRVRVGSTGGKGMICSYIPKRVGSHTAIIKQDCVEWNRAIAGGIQQERNIHNCACQEHICRRVNALDLHPWRIIFFKRWIIFSQEQAEETTVVFQCRVH